MRRRFFLAGSGSAFLGATAGRAASGPARHVRVDLPQGQWTLSENLAALDGAITLTAPDGTRQVLRRYVETCAPALGQSYCGLDFARVAYAERDLLAEALLASGDDPDPHAVRDAAPPMDSDFPREQVGRLVWTSFVAPPNADGVMPLTPAGNTRNWHVNRIAAVLSAGSPVVANRREGLLGGSLPIIVKQFALGDGRSWEVITFAEAQPTVPRLVPTWTRMTLVHKGQVERVVYGGSYIDFGPINRDPDEGAFNAALIRCVEAWNKALNGTLAPQLPEPEWADLARHAFVKEDMVRLRGVWPRYGVVDRDYDGSEYDGFQDTFTASLLANLHWGRFDKARLIFDNYFSSFIGDDGLVAMRGQEVGQTGLTLSLVAQYLALTGDIATVRRHAQRIGAISDVLRRLHDDALALPEHSPGHGLLHGWSESDACLFPDPSIWWKPYFGNSALVARGWKDLGGCWARIQPDEAHRAQEWRQRAEHLSARLNSVLRASIFQDRHPPYVPILPGSKETFRESLARHQYSEQQWAHRVYAELLQAGVLAPDLERATIESMRAHGATVMGVVGNLTAPNHEARDILGFISYGYALALLRQDRIEDYLLFLYAHRYHAHTRGSWTAAEVADLRGGLNLFCLPAQMTVPLLLLWALVFEDDQAEVLHLGRALPRRWLLAEKGVSAENVPTRWGTVSFAFRYESARRQLVVTLDLPAGAPADTRVYFRLPKGLKHEPPVVLSPQTRGKFATFGLQIDGSQGGSMRFAVPIAG